MSDDDLTAAEEAAVRARLAEARHTDPVPADVASRLDAVLADLTAGRREDDVAPPAPVVPLPTAASRRRRALTTGLVAAAALVALGVALPQVIGTSGSDDAGSASTADRSTAGSGDDAGAGRSTAGSAPGELAPGDESGLESGQSGQESGSAFAAPLALTSGEPLRPAVRALARAGSAPAYDADTSCAPDAAPGDRVAATWDGEPAVVVLRAPDAGRRLVEVYDCGSGEVVGTTSVRVP